MMIVSPFLQGLCPMAADLQIAFQLRGALAQILSKKNGIGAVLCANIVHGLL